jgi:hypothetical protein
MLCSATANLSYWKSDICATHVSCNLFWWCSQSVQHTPSHIHKDCSKCLLVQWLRLALSKGHNRVGVFPPAWGRKQIQFPKRCVFYFTECQTMVKVWTPSDSEWKIMSSIASVPDDECRKSLKHCKFSPWWHCSSPEKSPMSQEDSTTGLWKWRRIIQLP